MTHRFITYLLILLFSGQTLASVVDMHESHQSGEDHLAFEQDHTDHHANGEADKTMDKQTHDNGEIDFDCHHCCHCHGSSPSAMVKSFITVPPTNLAKLAAGFLVADQNHHSHPDLRPPIS